MNIVEYFGVFDLTFKIISTLVLKREIQAIEWLGLFPSLQQNEFTETLWSFDHAWRLRICEGHVRGSNKNLSHVGVWVIHPTTRKT